jgi:hypothetical protein
MTLFKVTIKFENLVFDIEAEDDEEAKDLAEELALEYNVCDLLDSDETDAEEIEVSQ